MFIIKWIVALLTIAMALALADDGTIDHISFAVLISCAFFALKSK